MWRIPNTLFRSIVEPRGVLAAFEQAARDLADHADNASSNPQKEIPAVLESAKEILSMVEKPEFHRMACDPRVLVHEYTAVFQAALMMLQNVANSMQSTAEKVNRLSGYTPEAGREIARKLLQGPEEDRPDPSALFAHLNEQGAAARGDFEQVAAYFEVAVNLFLAVAENLYNNMRILPVA